MHNEGQLVVGSYRVQQGGQSFGPAGLTSQSLGGLCSAEGNEGHLKKKLFDRITEFTQLQKG